MLPSQPLKLRLTAHGRLSEEYGCRRQRSQRQLTDRDPPRGGRGNGWPHAAERENIGTVLENFLGIAEGCSINRITIQDSESREIRREITPRCSAIPVLSFRPKRMPFCVQESGMTCDVKHHW